MKGRSSIISILSIGESHLLNDEKEDNKKEENKKEEHKKEHKKEDEKDKNKEKKDDKIAEEKENDDDIEEKSCLENGACVGRKTPTDFPKENGNDFQKEFKAENNYFYDFGDNKNDALEWGDKYHENYLEPNLTREDKQNIELFTRSKFQPVNEMLRNHEGVLPEINNLKKQSEKNILKLIQNLDKVFERIKLNQNMTVYRRISEEQFGLESGSLREGVDNPKEINQKVLAKIRENFQGRIFNQHGFMSTSLARDPHTSFGASRMPILLQIKLFKGTKAAYIEEISAFKNQTEVLINRGYKFRYGEMTLTYDSKGWKYLNITTTIEKL